MVRSDCLCVLCVALQTAVFSLLVHVRASRREYKVLAAQMERMWAIHNVSLSVAGEVVAADNDTGPPTVEELKKEYKDAKLRSQKKPGSDKLKQECKIAKRAYEAEAAAAAE